MSSTRKFVIAGTLWSGGGRIIAMLGNLALSVVLAHALSPADYGRFYLALCTVVIFAVVAALGMDQGVIRAVAMARASPARFGNVRRIINKCLAWVIAGATALALVAIAIATISSIDTAFGSLTISVLVIVWAAVATIQMQLAESYRALGCISWANIFGGVRSSGVLSALLPCSLMATWWLLDGLDLSRAVFLMLITSCAINVAAICLIGSHCGPSRLSTTSELDAGKLLHLGVPLWLSSIVAVLHSQGLLWLAAAIQSPESVATIAAAQRIVLVVIAPTAIVNAVLPPLIADMWERAESGRLERMVQVVAAVATLPSLAIFVLLLICGPQLLEGLFGAYYRNAYFPMLILCAAQVVNIATGSWQVVLAMTGHGRSLLWLTASGLVIFLAAAAIGSWRAHAAGIAFAWATGTIASNLAGLYITKRQTGMLTNAWIRRGDIAELKTAMFRKWKPFST